VICKACLIVTHANDTSSAATPQQQVLASHTECLHLPHTAWLAKQSCSADGCTRQPFSQMQLACVPIRRARRCLTYVLHQPDRGGPIWWAGALATLLKQGSRTRAIPAQAASRAAVALCTKPSAHLLLPFRIATCLRDLLSLPHQHTAQPCCMALLLLARYQARRLAPEVQAPESGSFISLEPCCVYCTSSSQACGLGCSMIRAALPTFLGLPSYDHIST
jgi:hypothetical protein